jgi:hypothetical protein
MTRSPTAVWREIPEEAADAHVADLYAEIRRCLGTSHVPTLYRVVAAHCYLDDFWRLLKPLLESPEADRFVGQAHGIGSDLARRLGGTPVVLRDSLYAKVIEVLESFNRGNPRNFLFSTAGRHLLGFEAAASARAWQLAPEAEGPSGPGLDPLWDDIRQAHGSAAIPGFYRVLGTWPDALRSLWAAAKPLLPTVEMDEARARLTTACRRIVDAYPIQEARRSATSADLACMLEWFMWANPTAILEIEYLRAHVVSAPR